MAQESFWDANTEAQAVFSQLTRLKGEVNDYQRLVQLCEDIDVLGSMASEDPDGVLPEIREYLSRLTQSVDALEVRSYLSQKYDR